MDVKFTRSPLEALEEEKRNKNQTKIEVAKIMLEITKLRIQNGLISKNELSSDLDDIEDYVNRLA